MPEGLPRIFGEYALLDPLGQGATGDVHVARPLDPNRGIPTPIVIKRLHKKYLEHEEFIKRFKHEAEIAILVDSPYVAKVYAVGAAGETLFIAMEFVPGFPISHLLGELIERNVHVSIPVAVELMLGGLDGLDALHEAKDAEGRPLSVVHRDISPKNLMAGSDGRLHLIDLGLGKSNVQDWKTDVGTIMGSPGYMAPEQIRGSNVDARADVYAMGVVLFELLTLRRFVKREAIADMLAAAVKQPFRAPSEYRADITPSLDRAVEMAVAKRPEDRFGSAREFAEALRIAVADRVRADTMVGFMQRILGEQLRHQAETIQDLLALPLPDPMAEPVDLTNIFALHPTVSSVPSPLSEGPTVRNTRFDRPSGPPSMMQSLTPVTDKNLGTAVLDPTVQKTRTTLKPQPGATLTRRRASRIRAPLIVALALSGGVAFGALVLGGKLSFETPPGDEAVIRDLSPPDPKIDPTPHVIPGNPERVDERPEPDRPEPPGPPREEQRPKTPPRKRPGPREEIAAQEREKPAPPSDTLSARTKSIEDRANALKARLGSDEAKSNAVQKVLYDLSLVRASRNHERALDQLSDLEARLAALESAR